MISTHPFLLLVLSATFGVKLPYIRCFLLPPLPKKNMIFVVDVWISLYFPSLMWKRAIFEVFTHGIFYFVLCMYQYQASRQPWWTVSFWFWSRPSGWCLQPWDVLNIWYDNLLHYFSSIAKNRYFWPLICFCAQFTGLWSQCSVHGHASSLTEAVGRHWHAVQHDKQPGKRCQIFLPYKDGQSSIFAI